MLKLTFAVLALALAGTASAGNWRKLRVDASSEAAFEQSLAVFKDELTPARRLVFGEALQDIWVQGVREAAAVQREYTAADYYRQLDGLSYDEIVTFTDPSGKTARTGSTPTTFNTVVSDFRAARARRQSAKPAK